jgi:hypothetical protein
MLRDTILDEFPMILPERFNDTILNIIKNKLFQGDLDAFHNHLQKNHSPDDIWASQRHLIAELDRMVMFCIPEYQIHMFEDLFETKESSAFKNEGHLAPKSVTDTECHHKSR